METGEADEDLPLWADRRLIMRSSPIQGVGTFATAPIAAGQVLTRVTGGPYVSRAQRAAGNRGLAVDLYAQDEVEPGTYRVWPKFIDYYFNHSCDANVAEIAIDGTQVTIRSVNVDEELTIDYLYLDGGRWPAEPCRCGSKGCRNPPRG